LSMLGRRVKYLSVSRFLELFSECNNTWFFILGARSGLEILGDFWKESSVVA